MFIKITPMNFNNPITRENIGTGHTSNFISEPTTDAYTRFFFYHQTRGLEISMASLQRLKIIHVHPSSP